MRNVKLEKNLSGDEYWPHMATLTVTGSTSAKIIEPGTVQPELENIIQSWDEIAVLQVTPTVEFYFGFLADGQAQYLNVPIEAEDGKFGVHIGDKDSTFVVFAKDMKTNLTLELIDRVDINDSRYASLPLY